MNANLSRQLLVAGLLASLLGAKPALAQVCPPPDLPDVLYQDTNLDGIDGDTGRAVFVAPGYSNANPGTMAEPVGSLEQGIILAASAVPPRDVYVAAGLYTLTSSLVCSSGVSLYGQFDGPPNWQRSGGNTTTIGLASGPASPVVISAIGLAEETHIEGFTIVAPAAGPAGSSYGILVSGGTGPVVIRYNDITAGAGGAGLPGAGGSAGATGGNGGTGGNGSCDGSTPGSGGPGGTSSCGRYGGAGGLGGAEGLFSGANGATGAGDTPGGIGGAGWSPGYDGTNGAGGTSGTDGAHGSPAPGIGTSAPGGYAPAGGGDGADGTPGNGGGGGGGGGGQGDPCPLCFVDDGTGNGGGGGGAGGCGGGHGGQGGGGGGSFGVYVHGNTTTVVAYNTITTGAGGDGGTGGDGGPGGAGGTGGPGGIWCSSEVGEGGNGGGGGSGGRGGAGSGGSGGPSIGLYVSDSSIVSAAFNGITTGAAGAAGAGGGNGIDFAPPGSAGLAQAVYGPSGPVAYALPSLCIGDIVLHEPAPDSATVAFTVYLSSEHADSVRVDVQTGDSSATAGTDFQPLVATLVAAPFEMVAHGSVTIYGDGTAEPEEVLHLTLSNAVNAAIGDSLGRVTIFEEPVEFAYDVRARWNLVSLPIHAGDPSVAAIFPSASSPASAYTPGVGYVASGSMATGPGYWLKFPAAQTVGLIGYPLVAETVQVAAGWNLIGSITDSVPAGSLNTIPPGLLTGSVFGYNGGYYPVDQLRPSMGHWVKATDAGLVVLSPGGGGSAAPAKTGAPPFSALAVRDAAGHAQTLYYGELPAGPFPISRYDLPPVPPDGVFDVRFATQRFAEAILPGSTSDVRIQVASAVYPLTLRWTTRGRAVAARLRVGTGTVELRGDGSVDVTSPDDALALLLDGGAEMPPARFALEQNYPNPFNPVTTFTYQLAAPAHVVLAVWNAIGQEVARLVDAEAGPGSHSVRWEGEGASSGVYFARMIVTDERGVRVHLETRKLVLLR